MASRERLVPDTPWHRAPVNSDVTFCGLAITPDLHLASRPNTATCPYCIDEEAKRG